jgi:molybdenum cofactor cytidylyltransferase
MAVEKGKGKNIGIVLLAAGASVRLGRPKQLLQYHGQSLLKYSIQNVLASNAQPVVVVLGANANNLQNEANERGVHVVANEDWQQGMSTSIRRGIKTITDVAPAVEGIILMVCDQPYVSTNLLNKLLHAVTAILLDRLHFSIIHFLMNCSS